MVEEPWGRFMRGVKAIESGIQFSAEVGPIGLQVGSNLTLY